MPGYFNSMFRCLAKSASKTWSIFDAMVVECGCHGSRDEVKGLMLGLDAGDTGFVVFTLVAEIS